MSQDKLSTKKKFLVYLMSVVMGTVSLTGCNNENSFEYVKQEDGTIDVDGLEDYDDFKCIKLIHLTNEIAELDEYHLVYECEIWNRYVPSTIYYKSIETGKKVYEQTNDDFKNFKMEIVIDHMVDYLYKYDMVKDNYSIEDVKSLKQLLLEDEDVFNSVLQESSNKVLSKRKIKC